MNSYMTFGEKIRTGRLIDDKSDGNCLLGLLEEFIQRVSQRRERERGTILNAF